MVAPSSLGERERHAGALTSGCNDTQPLPLAEKPTQDNHCPGEHPLGNGGQHSCWPLPPMPMKFKQGGPPGQAFTHSISTALQGLSTPAHRWFPGPEPSLSQVQVRQEVLCRLLHGPQLTPARREGAGQEGGRDPLSVPSSGVYWAQSNITPCGLALQGPRVYGKATGTQT